MDEKNINNEETNDKAEVISEGIQISDDVVAVIAGKAVSEVSGDAGMAGGFAGGITEVLSGKKNLIVEYGVRIPDVAFKIQNRVKKAVEAMTGLTVLNVNVHVQGVKTIEEKEEQTQETTDDK